jgi:Patatin-like phospholipase
MNPRANRALIFQGGGSLGAYEAGAYKAIKEELSQYDRAKGTENEPIFHIVSGTSIGAINGSVNLMAHSDGVNHGSFVLPYTCKYGEILPVIYGCTIGKRIVDGDYCTDNFNWSFRQRDVHPFFRRPDLSIDFIGIDANSYAPRLELINPDGSRTGKTRQYLKVRVKNIGGVIARNCRAKLRVTRNISMRSWPSDSKMLAWDTTNSRYIDIAKDDDEFLHVVFADSDFSNNRFVHHNNLYAMASTVQSIYSKERFLRAQDSFSNGECEIEILVRSEEGAYARAKYQLNVGDEYSSLNLRLLSHKQSITAKSLFHKLSSPISKQLMKIRKKSSQT